MCTRGPLYTRPLIPTCVCLCSCVCLFPTLPVDTRSLKPVSICLVLVLRGSSLRSIHSRRRVASPTWTSTCTTSLEDRALGAKVQHSPWARGATGCGKAWSCPAAGWGVGRPGPRSHRAELSFWISTQGSPASHKPLGEFVPSPGVKPSHSPRPRAFFLDLSKTYFLPILPYLTPP